MSTYRVVVALTTALLVLGTASVASAQSELFERDDGDGASGSPTDYTDEEHTIGHMPGIRAAIGLGPDDRSNYGVGLGYMMVRNLRYQILESDILLRFGGGPEVNVVWGTDEGLDGAAPYLAGRAMLHGPRGGLTFETGLGGVVDDTFTPGLKLGALYAFSERFELGYVFQTALAREAPDWMTPHQISLRYHMNLIEHY